MNVSDFEKGLEDIGYVRYHTWNESHGDGGQTAFERNFPMAGGMPDVMMVCFNRYGELTGIYAEKSRGSFVLAARIASDQELPEGEREWEPMGNERNSACGTSGWKKFRLKSKFQRDKFWDYVHVESVAGHGSVAKWQRSDGKYKCHNCGRDL